MNILVIGNGFDLAHGLPTKYTDFLEFCKMTRKIYESRELTLQSYEKIFLANSNLNEEIKQRLLEVFTSREIHKNIDDNNKIAYTFSTDYPKSDELFMLVKDNFWIEYFSQCDMHGEENWINFESEISNIIVTIDNNMQGLDNNYGIYDEIADLADHFLKLYFIQKSNNKITYKAIKDKLEKSLNKLIRVFEIYLAEYVEKIEYNSLIFNLDGLGINKVLSFNYTNTFEKLYGADKSIEYDYIHGKADISNTVETNNMVLGIDEYLPEDRKNKDVEFIAFKKYYQRIHKQTGCTYKVWVDEIRQDYENYLKRQSDAERLEYMYEAEAMQSFRNRLAASAIRNEECPMHNLYIFGHSLDITDKDILRDLVLNNNVHTTIYYPDKEELGKKIANLVKVIGQDELIRRTGGRTKTIEFKQQKLMEKREDK